METTDLKGRLAAMLEVQCGEELGQDDRHSYYGVLCQSLEHGDGSITVSSLNSRQNHSEPSYETFDEGNYCRECLQ